jgi:hypothetical protein
VVGTDVGEDEDVFSFYLPGYPALLWGRWLRDYAGADDIAWKRCFRSRLLEQLNGLDDEDPTNDTAACVNLAISLFQAGDKQNAASIITTLFKTLEDYLKDKEDEEAENPDEPADEPSEEEDYQYPDEVKENNTTRPEIQGWEVVDQPAPAIIAEESLSQIDISDTVNITQEPSHSEGCENIPELTVAKSTASSVLELHFEKNAWIYSCDGCQQDAKDVGSM